MTEALLFRLGFYFLDIVVIDEYNYRNQMYYLFVAATATPEKLGCGQGFISQPVSGNRRALVPVYRTGLTGYRWKPVEFKSKFK